MALTMHDQNHVTAADGYADLGMYVDANEELEKVSAEERNASEVLAIRERIYFELKKWDLMQVAARALLMHEPEQVQWSISFAYATRRVESIQAAKLILLAAVERHPQEPMLHYNLACYECQLGDIEVAKARLEHAFKLEPRVRLIALEDEDLAPLWDSPGSLL